MKLGIALGGGGAKGFAHIGVLEGLSAAGIDFEIVSGTSVGALVGAIYAAGNLENLKTASINIKLADIPLLLSPSWSTQGFFSGKNALELLNDIVGVKTIEDLPKCFAAISVDLNSSRIVTFTKGDIKTAMRASFALPAVFTPVPYGEQVLVDGGTLEPVPVQTARYLGAEFVVAVDLFGNDSSDDAILEKYQSALWPKGISSAISYLRSLPDKWLSSDAHEAASKMNVLHIIERTLCVTQKYITTTRLNEHPADLIIAPPVANVGFLDFHRGEPIIEIGRKSAEQMLPKLLKKLDDYRSSREPL